MIRTVNLKGGEVNCNSIDIEPTTAVVRGGKRSLRARITAVGGCLKRDLRTGSVCMYVCLSVCSSRSVL